MPRPGDEVLDAGLLRGRLILAKNPNVYINESQWGRARALFEAVNGGPEGLYTEAGEVEARDPLEGLPHASSRSFGDYDARRRQLLERGRRWLEGLRRLWARGPWLVEGRLAGGTVVRWADGSTVEACGAVLRFTEPWFHGVEYDRTGWVVGLEVEAGGVRLFYSSDVMGPIIEDYADHIIRARPDLLVLDGPPTYLYPYMLNRVNLGRAVENAIRIIESRVKAIVYDHHLLRDPRWRHRVAPVLQAAQRAGAGLATAAEHLGMEPLIDRLARGH